MVSYIVLGDLAVLDSDGRPIPVPAGRTRQVLALLLVRYNRLVSFDDLIAAGWGDTPPATDQLPRVINDINKILKQSAGPARVKNNRGLGYTLVVPTDELDIAVFESAIPEAEDDPERAIAALRRALGVWRGPRALSNLPEGALGDVVAALDRRRLRAATRLIELEVNRSGHEAVVADAVEYFGFYPLDRRLCEFAMITSYECGHPDAAVRIYQRHVEAIEADSAGEPHPGLRDLQYAMVRGDDADVRAYQETLGLRPPPRPAGAVPLELPAPPATLVARDDLMAEATWLLGRAPDTGPPVVLVISGRSGIGKTAMARSVAHEVRPNYPGGVIYLEARDATGVPIDASECLAYCLLALGVVPPEGRTARAGRLRTELARRRMLLVLDDVHDENQVRDLIPGSAGSAVIITTHHDLPGLPGARTLRQLRELEMSQSVDLYRHLVRAAGRDPDEDDPGQTERLLAGLEGLPLAIAIVAAQRVLEWARPVEAIADRVQRRGPLALEYHDLSVARSIGASLERLDDEARALFLGLGRVQLSHVGAWTAWAVLDTEGADPYGALSQLLASNVVTADEPGRYRLHSLTRRYAAWCAEQEAGTDNGVASRVYRALLTLVRRAHRALHGGDYDVVHSTVGDWQPPAALLAEVDRDPRAWFDRARANIRAAVRHCAELGLSEVSWDLAVSAHEYYTVAGQHDDWYETHMAALEACRASGDLRGEAVLLVSLGQPALVASRRAGAVSRADLRRAAAVLAKLGDEHGQAIALRTLANSLRRDGQLAEPLRLFEAAFVLYGRSDDAMGRWQTQRFIGQTYLDRGDQDRALAVLAEALAAAVGLGSTRLVAQSHYWLGQAYLAVAQAAADAGLDDGSVLARIDDAQAAFEQVQAMAGQGLGRGYALHGLGEVARRRKDFAAAESGLAEAARLAREGADAVLEGRIHVAMADVWHAKGRGAEGIRALEHAVSCFASADNRYLELAALAALSRAHPAGSPASRAAWERVEARYRELDLPDEDRIHRPPPQP